MIFKLPYNKFKNEYESLNGKTNENGKKYRKITISKNNPFVYAKDEEIIKMINNKKSFYVYFGANWCPWCRSVLPIMIESSKKNNINTIYYVDITGIRDEYTLEKNKAKLNKKGSKAYYKLIKEFDNVLNDYTLTSDNSEKISVNKKRIYAPSIIRVEKGKSIKLETGISNYQKDPYMKLNNKIKLDVKNKFDSFFK